LGENVPDILHIYPSIPCPPPTKNPTHPPDFFKKVVDKFFHKDYNEKVLPAINKFSGGIL
jgi:hypothetical protein